MRISDWSSDVCSSDLCRPAARDDRLCCRAADGAGGAGPHRGWARLALGRQAVRQGHSVLFVAAPALDASLVKAHADGRLEEWPRFYAQHKPMIVDELGALTVQTKATQHFHHAVSPHYRRRRHPV